MTGPPDSPPNTAGGPRPLFVVMSDLMFRSRIDDVARQLGLPIRAARSAEQLERHLAAGPPSLVLVDLEDTEFDSAAAVRRLRDHETSWDARIIGFSGHTNKEAIRAGRDAGVDQVLARSALTSHVAKILAEVADRERARQG